MEDINKSIAQATGRKTDQRTEILTASDCMVPHAVSFHPEQRICDVAKIFVDKALTSVPVLDDESKLVGILCDIDCLRAIASGIFQGSNTPQDRRVCDEMSTAIVSVDVHDNIYSVVELFAEHSCTSIPVLEDGQLVGRINRHNVLQRLLKA